MKRILCVWLPRWPVQCLLAARPECRQREIVVYRPTVRQGQQVFVCNSRAEERGVQAGMPLAEALSLPALKGRKLFLHAHDPAGDRAALEKLAAACEVFSPLVSLADTPHPDSLLLDITGLEKFFGGEKSLAGEVLRALEAQGYRGRAAIASTPSAAWALAQFDAEERPVVIVAPGKTRRLFSLPLAALRLSPASSDVLQRLGLTRIGQLARIDRSSLKARFGPEIGIALDRLLDVRSEVLTPPPRATCFQQSWVGEYPAATSESVQHILQHVLRRLTLALQTQQQGCLELTCRFELELFPARTLRLHLYHPTADARMLSELLQLQLERLRLAGPVSELHVVAEQVAPLAWRQRELFAAEPPRQSEALGALLNRLSSRLSPERVVRFQIRSAAVPEHACVYAPAVSAAVRQASARVSRFAPGERPLWLYGKPRPLRVQAVGQQGFPSEFLCESGTLEILAYVRAERIESAWWRGRMVRRDYYRVTTRTGQRLWLFQRLQDERWFLHGEFL